MKNPFVSVIIPVYNDAERLGACLDCLTAQTYPPDRFEILVVDNGSPAPPLEVVAASSHARLLVETRRGSYAARNAGARAARGEILAFTDADAWPEPTWIEQGVQALTASAAADAAGGRVELVAGDPPTLCEAYELVFGFRQQANVERRRYAVTANLFVRREAFERAGPFDAELASGGDQEWGRRATGLGCKLVYADDAVVRHPTRPGLRDLLAKRKRVTLGLCDLAAHDPAYRLRFLVKLAKILPSLRYRLIPVWRARTFPLRSRLALSGLVVMVHYYEYGFRLVRAPRTMAAWCARRSPA